MKHHKILQQSLHEIDISMIALHYVHSDHRVDSDDVVKWEDGQHRDVVRSWTTEWCNEHQTTVTTNCVYVLVPGSCPGVGGSVGWYYTSIYWKIATPISSYQFVCYQMWNVNYLATQCEVNSFMIR